MAQIPNIVPCLWFDGRALEAAEFYVSPFPDSHIDQILRSSVDTPGAKKGDPLLIEFTLAGKQHQSKNGEGQKGQKGVGSHLWQDRKA